MVDSRQKGARAEAQAKDLMKKYTGLGWERTPSSGALDEKHGLKGDLYVPREKNLYTVEVKHYKDNHLTSKVLTDKLPQIWEWWDQTERQSIQNGNLPLLLFKFDRSKWFGATNMHGMPNGMPDHPYRWLLYSFDEDHHEVYIFKAEDWLINEKPRFVG